MRLSTTLIAGAVTLGVALSATAWAAQQPAVAPAARPAPPVVTGTVDSLPDDLKPLRVAGAGLNVNDLAGMRAWYEKVLGMKLQQSFPAGSATPTEFVMSMNPADPNAAVVALLHAPRQPGATTFGRIIMIVPDADKAAAFLLTHGVSARKVSAGAYFAQDPEGNNIELYTPPAPGEVGKRSDAKSFPLGEGGPTAQRLVDGAFELPPGAPGKAASTASRSPSPNGGGFKL